MKIDTLYLNVEYTSESLDLLKDYIFLIKKIYKKEPITKECKLEIESCLKKLDELIESKKLIQLTQIEKEI